MLPQPYYEDSHVTIYHGDCRDILPLLEPVDLVLTDPPYGIGWQPRVNHRGAAQLWFDNVAFDPAPFLAVGKYHLFWGANHFADKLPVSPAWFVWVKRPMGYDFSNDLRSYATIELAWSNFPTKAAHKVVTWDGGMRAGETQNRTFEHPSQKPIELMRWCIERAPQGTILDPFMGSGTTLRAAKDLNRRAIGIEIEESYAEVAAKRMRQEVLPFTAPASVMKQSLLLNE